jgi:hypothetical protein
MYMDFPDASSLVYFTRISGKTFHKQTVYFMYLALIYICMLEYLLEVEWESFKAIFGFIT